MSRGPFKASTNIRDPRQYVPIDPLVRNFADARAPATLRAIAAQFDVTSNPRYQPTPIATYCNIFIWDVTHALGCEIPHWVLDPKQKNGWREMNVNSTLEWMEITGGAAGWREVDATEAARRADVGCPTVVMWRNPKGAHGHIALLLPSKGAGILIAQAGSTCYFEVPLVKGFGAHTPLRYFTHA